VPGRLSYRAYGAVRAATGFMANPFRFNGYVSDGSDELSSPSRYYSLGTGRFTSMDPATPLHMDPMTWNAYVGLNSNPMVITDPTGRYGEGGHYYTTYIVARETGYNHEDALKLALYSQLPDEIGKFDAIHQPIEGSLRVIAEVGRHLPQGHSVVQLPEQPPHPPRFYDTNRTQGEFHAITGGLSEPETALSAMSVINAPDLETAGLAIHRLGDTFAHRVMGNQKYLYAPGTGHLGDWHDPDMISTRPKLYGDYVTKLTETLAARQGKTLTPKEVAAIRAKVEAVINVPIEQRNSNIQAAYSALAKGYRDNSDIEVSRGTAQLAEAAVSAQVVDDQMMAALRAKAMSYPEVVNEKNTEPGSMLLKPEVADGSYFDAQGDEFKNAMNFLEKSNPMAIDDPLRVTTKPENANSLLKNLESSALKLLETQKRCRNGSCK
jgi:RHS repeat-associated protein